MTTTKNVSLSQVLYLTYDIEGDLLIALEAFLRKLFSQENLDKFVQNPNTMYKLLSEVVWDDLHSFSYTHEWYVDYEGGPDEPYTYIYKHIDNIRESTQLFYLKDGKEVEAKDIYGSW